MSYIFTLNFVIDFGLVFISFLALYCGFFLFFGGFSRIISLFLLAVVVWNTLTNYVLWDLTGVGFNESIIPNLTMGLSGAPLQNFMVDIAIIVIFIVIFIVGAWRLFLIPKEQSTLLNSFILLSIQIVCIFPHSLILGIYKTYKTPYISVENNFDDFFHTPIIFSNKGTPKNIVWVYLESFERTYLDENIFPNLIPNIKKIENENISFTNVQHFYGTGWTIAGIVATQCGMPLIRTFENDDGYGTLPLFLPKAICLGDILHKIGYNLIFMQGSPGEFGGNKKFFQTHQFAFLGLDELAPKVAKKDIKNWGITDDALLKIALGEYEKLLDLQKPFFLGVSTINTHPPEGVMPEKYEKTIYGKGDNKLLNVIRMTDKILPDFIREIQNIDTSNSTIIVISSDHLSLPNTVFERLNQGIRRNLAIVITPGEQRRYSSDRLSTMFDLGSTVLDMAGVKIPGGIGLGRSLIESNKTLLETFGNNAENIVRLGKVQLSHFW